MKIAIASGKGGTGKTTLATNLARVLARRGPVQYIDCDVEEPNGRLFLRPVLTTTTPVTIPVPQVDAHLCTHCGACSRLCQYHAIVSVSHTTMIFPELCHGCGGCARVCPEKAIAEVGRPIGVVETGLAGDIAFVHGLLNIGETSPTQLIRAVQGRSIAHSTILVDAPPGTSCAAMAAVRGCDRVALVAEPTAFGLHDLTLAVEMAQAIEMPVGVVINRSGMGDDRVDRFCASSGLPIWGRIPHDRRIAEACARGEIAVDTLPELLPIFLALADVLVAEDHA